MNPRCLCFFLSVLLTMLGGCGPTGTTAPASAKKAAKSKIASKIAAKTSTKARSGEAEESPTRETANEFDFDFTVNANLANEGGGYAGPDRSEVRAGLAMDKIAGMIGTVLKYSVEYGPTLAVWFIDESQSARSLVMDVASYIQQPNTQLVPDGESQDQLLTAVVTFGQAVHFAVDPPTADSSALGEAMNAAPTDDSGQEMLFTALGEALQKYQPFRTTEKREVLFFVVTDEAGDDQASAEEVIETLRKSSIPVYTIGVPAPFGRVAAIDSPVEGSGDASAMHQGPETRYPEHIQMGFWGGSNDLRLMASGFGPFALERLCRASNGRYLAVRPATGGYAFIGMQNTEWPNAGAWQPDPAVMRKYTPQYLSEGEYRAQLQNNAACQALHEAAKLPELTFNQLPQLSFVKASEAEMVNILTTAQQVAAKMEPGVNRLFETLEKGEAARDKLTDLRWQAAFDCAMGRATAAKCRVEGYNEMLAELKRGKSFMNASSTTWDLVPAETTDTTSKLKKQCEKATEYLKRVVEQHPGTPWAKLAEYELQTPVGWKWSER